MIQIKINNEEVVGVSYENFKREGWIEIESIPDPENREGYYPVMYYRNGEIEYEYLPVPEEPSIVEDNTRAITEDKVKTMFFTTSIPTVINTFGLTNKEALSVKDYFPEWSANSLSVKKGERYQCDNLLWEVVQEHTTQESWKPSLETSSLWKVVEIEHEGTQEDPIPYTPPMEIFKDKYYIQDNIKYKCIRNSELPLSHNLNSLIGTYVEKV